MARQGGGRRVRGGRASSARSTSAPAPCPRRPSGARSASTAPPAAVNSLSEWLSVLWLTPAMDRLFSGSAGDRRRFLDRWCSRWSRATRTTRRATTRRCGRATSCLPRKRWDEAWLASLELAMAEHGAAIAAARERTVAALDERLAEAPDDEFARAAIALEGWDGGDLAAQLSRRTARATPRPGRATEGPHRQDLAVLHRAKQMPAAQLLDRRAEGAAARPGPRPCRAGRRPPRRAADPAARRSRRPSRSQAPRRSCSLASKAAARCG